MDTPLILTWRFTRTVYILHSTQPHLGHSKGVLRPVVLLLWSKSGTKLLECRMYHLVWFGFTLDEIHANQSIWESQNQDDSYTGVNA